MTRFRFQRGRLIVVPVRFRHRSEARRRMAVDTGARVTIIRPDLAEEIGLDLREDPETQVVGIGGVVPVSRGVVDEVVFLGHAVRGVDVACQDLHPALAFHGILGLDVLQHFNVHIDHDDEVLSVEPCHW
jgi:predicted aspartyl protease